jgi:hypothetical protein
MSTQYLTKQSEKGQDELNDFLKKPSLTFTHISKGYPAYC